ncbi:Ig domain-containing protein [Acetobacterium bakii]|nr:Ig domain-containing protein [Acetobacterium bakii]
MKRISVSLFTIIMMLLMVFSSNVLANDASAMGVAYRAHIQDVGNYPTDGTWVQGSDQIGTPGLSRRIEGVNFKLTGDIPAGAKIVYNLHIQDYGWLCDVNNPSTWQEGPDFAGTTGESKRIEAIQIKLLDASNRQLAGYSVQYSGHVQDVGDVAMVADGSKLGTVGASQRLECLSVGIVKVADFVPYYRALGAAEKIIQTKDDYTPASVAALEKAIHDHPVPDTSTQATVDAATKAINEALTKLVKATTDVTAPEISELDVTFTEEVGADEKTISYTVTDADSYLDFDTIKNINNYTFAGIALPAGSTVTTDAATVEQKETKVTIHIPVSAVSKTVDGVFAISGIEDVDGNVNTAITQTGNIDFTGYPAFMV